MPRPADPQRFDALNVIRKYVHEHGEQEGARLAKLDGYKHVHKATWSQWCKIVREEDRNLVSDVVLHVPRPDLTMVPAVPSVTLINPVTIETRQVVQRSIDFFKMLGDMVEDANLLAEYAAPTGADGVRKLRNPMMLVQAHRAKALNMQLALKHAEAAWHTELMKEFEDNVYDLIIQAIDGEDPVIVRRIAKSIDGVICARKRQLNSLTPGNYALRMPGASRESEAS